MSDGPPRTAVVMAGGEGSRLRPMTAGRPKPLVPICNRPIMGHILKLLAREGFPRVVATVHYLADEIQNAFGNGSEYGVEMHYSLEPEPLGTAGSVKLAQEHLTDTFVIVSGDALTDCRLENAWKLHKEKGSMATLVLCRVPNPLEFGIVILKEDGQIDRFLEKPGWSEVFSDTVNTGIYIIEPEVLDLMEPGKSYDWSRDIFPLMLEKGMPMHGFVMEKNWSDIGTIDQYQEAQIDLLQGRYELEIPGTRAGAGITIGSGTVIDDSAQIRGPVCIGAGCRIKAGAIIGPDTVIGDNCLIDERAEITGSVVWESSYIGMESCIEGAVICSHNVIKRGGRVLSGAVIGDRCLIDVGGTVRSDVKIWPNKTVDRGATVTMSLASGSRWRGTLFREQGVAGLSNIEITPEFAVRLGLAIGSFLPQGSVLATSRDSSRSSRMTKRALISSLLSTGCQVVDLRSSPVPVTRHFVRASGAAAAVNIRKLPLSPRATLIEIWDTNGVPLPQAQERKIESSFFREEYRRTDPEELGMLEVASRAGEMYMTDFLHQAGPIGRGKTQRIVVDYGYSTISRLMPDILSRMGIEAIAVNAVNDARKAPRRQEEVDEHLRNLAHIVGSLGYDMGVLFTGEGERMALVDDRGIPLVGLGLLGTISQLTARLNPGSRIGLSVFAPTRLEEHLTGLGAKVCRIPAGSRAMGSASASGQIDFAGDLEGGFVSPHMTHGFDAMFALARLLQMLQVSGQKLSDAADNVPEFHLEYASIHCPWSRKGQVMRRVAEEARHEGEIDLLDGVRVVQNGGWVLVLPDAFEPVVHIYAEGEDTAQSRSLIDMMSQRIKSYGELK